MNWTSLISGEISSSQIFMAKHYTWHPIKNSLIEIQCGGDQTYSQIQAKPVEKNRQNIWGSVLLNI